MNRIRTFLGAAGLLFLGGVCPAVVACSKDPVPPSSQNPIKIGVSYAKTGSYNGVGIGLLQGVQAAAYVINARGGVLGRPIQVLAVDDESSNENGSDKGAHLTDVIKGFIAQKVAAIIGPGATVQVRDAMLVAYPEGPDASVDPNAANVLLLSAWATSPVLTSTWKPWPNRFFYRTPPSDYYQRIALWRRMTDAPALADGGPGTPPCQYPFLVYANDALGSTYLDFYTKKNLQKYSEGVPTSVDPNGYQHVVDAIKAAPNAPDCLAFVTYADVTASVINTLATNGIVHAGGPKLYASDAGYDPTLFTKINDPNTLNGMAGVEPDTSPLTRNYQDFQDIFQALTPTANGALVPPPNYSANAFDAMVLVAFAIQRAQTDSDPTRIRDALVEVSRGYEASIATRPTTINATTVGPSSIDVGFNTLLSGGKINYDGASGPVDFDQNGDVAAGYVKWDVVVDNNGQRFVVETDPATSRYSPQSLSPLEPD